MRFVVEVLYKEQSYQIMGACFEVHNEMGCGFLESVYQECLSIELGSRDIPFVAQQDLQLVYKEKSLQSKFKPDFVCYRSIILEIKAVREVCDEHRAQVRNYLKATGHRLGLLVNFGSHPKLQSERIVR